MPVANFTTQWHITDAAYASDTLCAGCFQLGATGTNKTFQAAIQRTDLVLVGGGGGVTCSSAATPFAADDVGNYIIQTAGAGFTLGVRYRIVSVAAGVATLDASAGVAGSTGGTSYLGGAMRSPGGCAGAIGAATHQTVQWTGSHTNTTDSNNVSGGRITLTDGSQWIGYNTTVGDGVFSSTMLPFWDRGAFTTALVTTAVNAQIRNVRISATSNGTLVSSNFANVSLRRCWIDAHRLSDSGGLIVDSCYLNLVGDLTGNTLTGVNATVFNKCFVKVFAALSGALTMVDSVVERTSLGAMINSAITAGNRWKFQNCSLIAVNGSIFDGSVSANVIRNMVFDRCILWDNALASPVVKSNEEYSILLRSCAYPTSQPPTHTSDNALLPNIDPVPLNANPFVNTPGGDYSLTETAKGLLRIALAVTPGIPGFSQFGWIGAEPIAPASSASTGRTYTMPPIYGYYPLVVGQVVPPEVLGSAVGTVFDTAGTYVFDSSVGVQHSMTFAVGFDGTVIRKLVTSAGGTPRLALGK